MASRLLVRLYPERWRRRYGDEFEALLAQQPTSPGLVVDVVAGALAARFHPYPIAGEAPMTTARRLQAGAAFVAALLVMPSLVFLAAALARNAQPVQYQPARAAAAVFDWFVANPAILPLIALGPVVALPLALVVLWRRIRGDAELKADLRELAAVSVRLLRRPAVVLGAFAVVASFAVLVVAADHLIAG